MVAMVGVAGFVVLVALLHLRRENAPTQDYISYYAVGRYGAVMMAAFVALGVGCLSLAVGIRRMTPGGLAGVGCALLGLAGSGLIVGGLARSDLEGTPATTTGAVHFVAAALVGLLGLFLAIGLLTVTLARRGAWGSPRRSWLALALPVVVAFLVFAATSGATPGLGQRILVSGEVLWLGLVAGRLRTDARTAAT